MPASNYVIDLSGRTLTRPETQPAPIEAPARPSVADWARHPGSGRVGVDPLTGNLVVHPGPAEVPDVVCGGCGFEPDKFAGARRMWDSSGNCPRCAKSDADGSRVPEVRQGRMARDRLFAREADELDYLLLSGDSQVGGAVGEAMDRHLAGVFDLAAARELDQAEIDLSNHPAARTVELLNEWEARHPDLATRRSPAIEL